MAEEKSKAQAWDLSHILNPDHDRFKDSLPMEQVKETYREQVQYDYYRDKL